VREVGFIRTNKHDIAPVIKKISKETDIIVDKLMKLVESEDPKVSHDACKTLLDYLERFTKLKDLDELQRLIANVKFGGPSQLEQDDTPEINFSNIIEA